MKPIDNDLLERGTSQHFDVGPTYILIALLCLLLILGDGSASTVWDNRGWPHIPENCNYTERPVVLHAHLIKHILPQAKILVILRNPIDRWGI